VPPQGNGHLGALVLGGTAFERFVLNESTLSNGGPYDPNHPEALGVLSRVRELVFQGDCRAAAALAEQKLMAKPKSQLAYQPLGEQFIECPSHACYSDSFRRLELDTAITTDRYVIDGLRYTREAFISYVDRVLVVRLTVSKPSAFSSVLRLASEQRGIADWQKGVDCWYGRNTFGVRGRHHEEQGIAGVLSFESAAELRGSNGRVMPGEALLTVRDTTELITVAAAATS
jgi:alpha-L-fucosidase 2